MDADAKKDLRRVAGITAVVAALVTGGVYVSDQLIAPVVPTITLAWDNADTNVVTEIWASTNLIDWTLKTNVIGTTVKLPRDKPAEFFKARNKVQSGTNWLFSDWARRGVTP